MTSHRVLYDFIGEVEGDLTVSAGDLVTVLDLEVGEGWVQALAQDGNQGIIPESYTEPLDENDGSSFGIPKGFTWDEDIDDDDEKIDELPDPDNLLVTSSSVERKVSVASDDVIPINFDSEIQWGSPPSSDLYTCSLGPGKKITKFGGITSYVQYPLTPTFSNIQVSRSVRSFKWVHDKLRDKFGFVIVIPPIPDWNISGGTEDDIMELRRQELQSFVERVTLHPVLSASKIWKLFISETSDKKWTAGKKKVDKEGHLKLNILAHIQLKPISEATDQSLSADLQTFINDIQKLDSALKLLKSVTHNQITKSRSTRVKELRTFGKALVQVGFAAREKKHNFVKIGMCYDEISNLWQSQCSRDWEPFYRVLYEYKDVQSKTEPEEKTRLSSYKAALTSEKNYFQQELNKDFRKIGQTFLLEQIKFYRQLADRLETLYNDCWPHT